MDIVGRLWEDSPLFLTREEFEATLQGWTIDPVEVDGRTIGVVLVKGPEFHFSKFDETPVGRAMLRKYPGSLIEQYGYALTRTPKDDERMLKFNERLGFFVIGEDEYDVHLRIEKRRV